MKYNENNRNGIVNNNEYKDKVKVEMEIEKEIK